MDCSMPGLPVPHHLPEFTQVHVHCIGDTIQPSHPLTPSSPSPQSFPASGTFPMSHLFASDDKNTEASASTSVLPMNIQGWSPLRLTDLISLLPRGISGVFSTLQFKGISSLAFSLLYSPALTTIHNHWEDHRLDNTDFCWQSNVSPFKHTV